MTDRKPNNDQILDLLFAWKVCKYVKSNAIIFAKDQRTIGIGAGQMSRVNSAKIARAMKMMNKDDNSPLTKTDIASMKSLRKQTKIILQWF